MAILSFKPEIAGLPLVVAKLRGVRAGIVAFVGKRRIEKYLVEKTKARFEPRGSNPIAQRAPDGRFWAYANPKTAKYRQGTNKSRTQALYETGNLQRSISITKKGPGLAVLGSSGTFTVGIRANARAARYGLVHQTGGKTPTGGVIPARPFLGVGKTEAEELGIMGKELIEARI